jgi:FkbM family methyltransferase
MGAARWLAANGKPVRVFPGMWVRLDLHDAYDDMVFTGSYERALFDFFSRALEPGDMFIDGGANVGLHSLAAAAIIGAQGRVLAFEPDGEAYRLALTNFGLNPDLETRISIAQAALGDRESVVRLAAGGDRNLESRVAAEGTPVECTTLDTALAKFGALPEVILCKLDIEGYELRALIGAERLLAHDEVIFVCELNDPLLRANGGSAPELIDAFRRFGFQVWKEDGTPLVRYDSDWPPWVNAIFSRGAVATGRVRRAFAPAHAGAASGG